MTRTEIHEDEDGGIAVIENLDPEEREAQSLERLVSEILNDDEATKSEKRLASALIALKNLQS